jgi:outer membrane protein OmpA-like peptidoglycan-associated protein
VADHTGIAQRAGWLGALVVVPLLLAAVALVWPAQRLSADLQERSTAALAAVGLPGVAVEVSGRDVALREVPIGATAAALDAVAAVTGVRSAQVEGPPATGLPTAPTAPSAAAPAAPGTTSAGLTPAERERVTGELAAIVNPNPILFWPDSAALPGPSAATVTRVAALLRATPAAHVELEGHVADTPGGPEVARTLSERRAVTVADALVAAGVDRSRIRTVGRGGAEPLPDRAASRRVEITIL